MINPIVRLEGARLLKKWPWFLGLALFSFGLAQAMTIEPASTSTRNYIARVLVGGCYANVIAFGMVVAVISGASLATERNSGTILFLCRLPVTRSRIYWSKAVFLFLVGGTLLIVFRGIITLNSLWSDSDYLGKELSRMPSFWWFLPSYLLIVSVGICGSGMITNPATSAFLAFLSPLALGILLAYIRHESAWLSEIPLLPIFGCVATVFALACLTLGGLQFCSTEDS